MMFFPLILSGCGGNQNQDEHKTPTLQAVPMLPYQITNIIPHDTLAFTEGLCWLDGQLYESTGSPDNLPQTRSYFGLVNQSTGIVEPKYELDRNTFFGEGITILHGRVFQLTYKNRKGFVYELKSGKRIGEFSFESNEGWGLTTDGNSLIMSDGSDVITFINPSTYKTEKRVSVTENGRSVENLNELEYIDGWIFANVYYTNKIIKIDPETGKVSATIDLSHLYEMAKNEYMGSLQMNGIAYDSAQKKMYITGKMWPKIFEISVN